MEVFRIVQGLNRTNDLSGTGAFRVGGRWNSKGVYMLYTASNRSLALLESLVHFSASSIPAQLYLMTIEVSDTAPVYELPFSKYPADWLNLDLLENKKLGDGWMAQKKFLAFKVRSAVNNFECNYLLNPLFENYPRLVKITAVHPIEIDGRLIGS